MVILVIILLLVALALGLHFFGLTGFLLAGALVFVALIIFVAMRGKRHPGDVSLRDPYLINRGFRSGPRIEEQEQAFRKLSE